MLFRLDYSSVNRKAFETLALSGGFDSFGIRREQFFGKNNKGETFRLVPDDPDALYCTTLIEKSFEPDLKLDLPRDVVKVPVVGGSYLFPAALWEADGMTHVCMIGKQKTSKP